LGEAYRGDHKTTEEIRALVRSVELDPSSANSDAYKKLASAYEDAKLIDKEIDTYKRLIATRLPRQQEENTRESLAVSYKAAKRFPEAIEEYKVLIRMRPDSVSYYEKLGDSYAESEQYDKAAQAFARETELDPKKAYGFGALGICHNFQKQYALSIEPLQQAIRLNPEEAAFHYYLVLSQSMLGHKSDAMEQYEELKKLKSEAADKLLVEINKQ
jgi:tetratricopeptide (TPR) repeat protein